MSVTSLSKEDYLKRYLEKPKKKAKRLKSVKKNQGLKIVEVDASLSAIAPVELTADDEERLLYPDDAPAVELIDDRPHHLQDGQKWKAFQTVEAPTEKHRKTSQKRRNQGINSAASPRKLRRSEGSPSRCHPTDSDASPPRHPTDSDASPPRHPTDSDASPPRHPTDSDASPPRHPTDSDASLPRQRHDSDASPPRRMSKTLGGRKAGLSAAAELRKELEEEKRKKNEAIDLADASLTGKGAKTVLRGKLRQQEVKEDPEEIRLAAERAARVAERHSVWGRGSAQVQNHEDKLEDDIHEMSKPLARYKNDEDLDKMLRDRIHEEDPMAAYMRKKAVKNNGDGCGIVMPKYSGPPAPPNRFSIPPGYRWDGVDRGNGFEKKYFETLSKKKAVEEEAYKWSTEDM